jgi:FKBP-type peptidyl-prolyl cis-trans isomerase FklB
MKFALLTGLALGLGMAAQAAEPVIKTNQPLASAEGASVLKNDVDKFSYSIGLNWGNQIRQQSIDVAPEILLRGLQDGLANKTPLMSSNEIQRIQDDMRKVIMAKRETLLKEMKEKNLAAANKFLEENAKKEGVKKMESGLQYKVVKEGSGPKPKAGDRVAVHYRGTLLNGTEFDASSRRGPEPAVFGVGQVIKGWSEALTNMNVGSKWELYIPPNLAYGEQGSRNIEPNSALIFDVELVEIKQPEPPPQPITSDIIKVPSKAELDAGAKIEIIKPEDLAKLTNKANQAAPPAPKPGTAPNPPAPK